MGKTPHGGIMVHVVLLFPAQCSVRQQLLPLNQPRWEFGVFIKYQGPLPREALSSTSLPMPLTLAVSLCCSVLPNAVRGHISEPEDFWKVAVLLPGCISHQ